MGRATQVFLLPKRAFVVSLVLFGFLFGQVSNFCPNTSHAKLPAGIAGTLSIIPGLGQLTNGDALEAVGWFVTSVGALFIHPTIGFNIWSYNMYDAYRDAGPGGSDFSNESVFENYIGAFNPLNIVDPIGGPFLLIYGGLGSGGQFGRLAQPRRWLVFSFVGLGEEGLFRGFLFPGFSYLLSSKWVGAIISSALFSAAHVVGDPNALQPVTFTVRFLAGMIFAWQLDNNDYDLRKNIFAHTWIDVLVADDSQVSWNQPPAVLLKHQIRF